MYIKHLSFCHVSFGQVRCQNFFNLLLLTIPLVSSNYS